MLNSKETLKKLHQALPNLTLDELFTILDCYTEEITYTLKEFEPNKIWYGNTTTGVNAVPAIMSTTEGISISQPNYQLKYGNISNKTKSTDYQLTAHN